MLNEQVHVHAHAHAHVIFYKLCTLKYYWSLPPNHMQKENNGYINTNLAINMSAVMKCVKLYNSIITKLLLVEDICA